MSDPPFTILCPAELANPPQEDVIGEVVVPPARKLQDLIRLAELCVDLLRQNEEFYAEVISSRGLIYVVLSCCHQHQLCETGLNIGNVQLLIFCCLLTLEIATDTIKTCTFLPG